MSISKEERDLAQAVAVTPADALAQRTAAELAALREVWSALKAYEELP